jgi:CheY-like chemotaxis protein
MAKTLLLADDSVTIQKVVNISFASEDVTLVTVDNGDDALERAKETRPDLILADVVMPGKNGYEVCEAIKADPDLAHIPVLLLTGTFEAFDEERAARAGAAGHVAKPFEAQTLVSQVNRLLAEAPPPAAARASAPVTPPEAITNPATGDAEKGDSFDFFDDDLADLAAPDAEAAESDSVSFEDSDSAFAFGDEDLAPEAPEPVREEIAAPRAPERDFAAAFEEPAVAERTVAILPDDAGRAEAAPAKAVPPAPAEVPPTALSDDVEDAGFGDAGDEMFAVPEREPDDPFALVDPSATSEEAFDFAFESEPPAAEPAAAKPVAVEPPPSDGLMSVEAEDLARATVLDPSGAAGYDVSSSDLGDPFAGGPFGEAAEPMDFAHAMDEPVAAAEVTGVGDFGEELEAAVFEPEERLAEPARRFEPPAAAKPESRPPAAARPAEKVRPSPDEPALRADAVLSKIAPTLRAEIHDTLEKVAWESFGDVTEKIVADAVDRVEKIAWEVIPQLAEALIKEEIRRIKGESDD